MEQMPTEIWNFICSYKLLSASTTGGIIWFLRYLVNKWHCVRAANELFKQPNLKSGKVNKDGSIEFIKK